MSSNLENPYRPFFFAGTIAALIGTGAWMLYAWIPDMPYPGKFHAHMMMGLFLMSFAMGFLMTALPRMTQTFTTRRYEFACASFFLGFLATVGITNEGGRGFFIGILFNAGFLIFFAVRRVVQRRTALPEIYPLLLWGLASAVGGALLSFTDYSFLGEKLFYLNFMLCLILGVGVKLIPMILKFPVRPPRFKAPVFALVGLLLTVALVSEEMYGEVWGSYLRAITVTLVAIFGWRLFSLRGKNSGLSWGIRGAALFTVLGTWALAVYPEYRLEALHVIYITGFSLMTFMIASRVILAHGNYGTENENANWFVRIPVFFLLLAGLTRVAAIFVPDSYTQHLGYAAASFVVGVSVWAKYFIPRIFTNYGQLSKP